MHAMVIYTCTSSTTGVYNSSFNVDVVLKVHAGRGRSVYNSSFNVDVVLKVHAGRGRSL